MCAYEFYYKPISSTVTEGSDLEGKNSITGKRAWPVVGFDRGFCGSTAPKKKKFKMSAAAKAKISAAAKARWAKIKGGTAAKPVGRKPKGKMSAATKAKLSAKLKAIWAKRRAAKK